MDSRIVGRASSLVRIFGSGSNNMCGNVVRRGLLGFAPVLFWLVLMQAAALAQSPATKLEALIKSSGYTSSKVNDNVWTIDFAGKQLAKYKVILSASNKDKDGIFVIFANPVEKSRLPSTANFMALLLKANHDFDYVKVGIDNDGDVFVRADIPDGADAGYFKSIVDQVAAATDQLYGRMKPLLRN
jgi:hypothetical protein